MNPPTIISQEPIDFEQDYSLAHLIQAEPLGLDQATVERVRALKTQVRKDEPCMDICAVRVGSTNTIDVYCFNFRELRKDLYMVVSEGADWPQPQVEQFYSNSPRMTGGGFKSAERFAAARKWHEEIIGAKKENIATAMRLCAHIGLYQDGVETVERKTGKVLEYVGNDGFAAIIRARRVDSVSYGRRDSIVQTFTPDNLIRIKAMLLGADAVVHYDVAVFAGTPMRFAGTQQTDKLQNPEVKQ